VLNAECSPTVAARHIDLVSCPNFRDVGGYRTSSGQWVRTGLAFRSGTLTLTPTELEVIEQLQLRAVYDLRTPGEIETAPDTVPAGATYLNYNVSGVSRVTVPETPTPEVAQQFMRQGVIATATAPSAVEAYHNLFTDIADRPGAGLFHCTAGKDRTGWASAVLLTLLEVPEETVLDDYLLSNEYYRQSGHVRAILADLPAEKAAAYSHFMEVKPEYLQAGLDAVHEQFGSMTDYALNCLGLTSNTLDKLHDKLLADGP
jgi:protein-tyrosine phosphatase